MSPSTWVRATFADAQFKINLTELSGEAKVITPEFAAAMRRIITAVDGTAGSTVALDGPPSAGFAGLHEIWREDIREAMQPADTGDRGPASVSLSAPAESVAVRWFVVETMPDGMASEKVKQDVARAFDSIGGAASLRNQDRDPTMHQTDTLDVVCLVSGSASLILDQTERRLSPGNVIIQRGTSHAWRAHGGPALFVAILIGRKIDMTQGTIG